MVWELLIYRLPTTTSGPRVAVWRELRRIGVLALQASVAAVPAIGVLPARLDSVEARIKRDGGTTYRFRLTALSTAIHQQLVSEWNDLRDQEYAGIIEQCEERLQREIEFEQFRGRFTFNDAQRLEEDLRKIQDQFAHIADRDVFAAVRRAEAAAAIQRSQVRLDAFVVRVYETEVSLGTLTLQPPMQVSGVQRFVDPQARDGGGSVTDMATSTTSAFDRLLDAIQHRRLSRRSVLRRATALGLSAPAISALLVACGGDDDDDAPTATAAVTQTPAAQPAATPTTAPVAPTAAATVPPQATATSAVAPTEASASPTSEPQTGAPGHGRGVGDLLRILYWQPPTILNPHLAQAGKDFAAASLVLEPLIDVDAAGNLIPVLAAEVPTLENGGVASDGMSVTFNLKQGVVWSDGEPLTAEDVRFTWEYATHPEAENRSAAVYEQIEDVEVIDDHTVTIKFGTPTPGWYSPFCTAYSGQVMPRHLLEDAVGAQAVNAAFNLHPIGTGPYKVTEFRPGDVVLYELNELYREPDKPYFKEVEFKGGGDAAGAARAVLQTGEAHWSWNLQIEKAVLEELATGDAGIVVPFAPINVEQMVVNHADPRAEGDARAEPSTTHPFLSDKNVRQAFMLGVDRATITNELYGTAGTATANLLVAPEKFASPNTAMVFDIAEGNRLLDEAGWVLDGDVRKKGDLELSVVYQTSVNTVRQKNQEIIKAAWAQMGIRTEIKAVDGGTFFSSDPGNPDTLYKFYADFEMFLGGPAVPYPINYMASWSSVNPDEDLSQRANQWTGPNFSRWVNEEYNELYSQAETEMDEAKQAELFIGMNDLLYNEVATIAIVARSIVAGVSKNLKGYNASPWTTDVRDIADWYWEE